jgi:hypothetical protein
MSKPAGIFGEHALRLREHGLAVLPVAGDGSKAPLIRGFHKWRTAPSPDTVRKFAEKHADANVAILTGLSGVVVVDVDETAEVDQATRRFGPTPLQVRTHRGAHLYYRWGGWTRCCNIVGLNAQIKAGTGIVQVPPSMHKNGTRYRHHNCDWSALGSLPAFNPAAIELEKPTSAREYRDGSRRQDLNDRLCALASRCADFDELLCIARQIAAGYTPPLNDAEATQRAKAVWRDVEAGAIGPMHGSASQVRLPSASVADLTPFRYGADALMMLAYLQIQHGARAKRGETFAVSVRAMAQAGSLPGWTEGRLRRARDLLIKRGHLIRVTPTSNGPVGRIAAQYAFGTHVGITHVGRGAAM